MSGSLYRIYEVAALKARSQKFVGPLHAKYLREGAIACLLGPALARAEESVTIPFRKFGGRARERRISLCI